MNCNLIDHKKNFYCPSTKGNVTPSRQPSMKEGVLLLRRKLAELLISPPVLSDDLTKTLIEKFSELNLYN